MNNDFSKTPIIITGCARSGTSFIAGIIERCGAFGGEMTGPTRYNQKGQYENKAIRDGLTKPMLRAHGYDPLGQAPLPNVARLKIDPAWARKCLTSMSNQGYNNTIPWFYKGAKVCLTWPIWANAFPNARYIIVRRDDSRIIDSCLKTAFMRAYKTRHGWQAWINDHKNRFSEMKNFGLKCYEVWPDKIIAGDLAIAESMINWIDLGLRFNAKSIKEFITPKLWHKGETLNV
jgi:hypothetical protein